jgi:hypothetical protein
MKTMWLLLGALLPSMAFAGDTDVPETNPIIQYQPVTVIEGTDQVVTANAVGPEMILTRDLPHLAFKNMIPVRRDFNDNMVASIDEVH